MSLFGPPPRSIDRQLRAAMQLDVGGMPSVTNGFDELDFDLSNAARAITSQRGFGVLYLREGSTPGGRLTLTGGAGRWNNMAPGDAFHSPFDELRAERGDRSVSVGTARLMVLRDPRVELNPSGLSDNISGSELVAPVGPNGALVQTAAALNAPMLEEDGVRLEGIRGARILVSADAGQTLSGTGTVLLYLWIEELARWARGSIEYNVLGFSGRDAVFPDEVVSVPNGALYAEARNVGVSAGALTVRIQTWG